MTKEEGVIWIMAWKRENIPKYNLQFDRKSLRHGISSGVEAVWLTGLADELIERIRTGEYDPVTEVAMYYYEMDEVLATSDDDHFITHKYAGYMAENAHAILSWLQKIEKETWDYRREAYRIQLQKALAERDIKADAESFLG